MFLEVEWTTLAKQVKEVIDDMTFEKPTSDMTKHLKPLYIKAHINGKSFNRMFVDGGIVLIITPLATMKRLGKNCDDLISTNMKMTSFRGHVLIANVTFGSKVTKPTFFVTEGKPSYVLILGRGRIHTSECVSSTLHQ